MDSRIRVILKIVHGVIGMAAGICGSAVFATKYGNLHAAVWAGISVFVALLYVQVNRSVFRDVHRMIKSRCFVMYMTIAGVFIVAGSVAMITYLAIGLSHKQTNSTTLQTNISGCVRQRDSSGVPLQHR